MKKLRLILGDQLNGQHSWFSSVNAEVYYVLMEIGSEQTYVNHHIQKIAAFFLAMRKFASELSENGHNVIYIKYDDSENLQSFKENCKRLIKRLEIEQLEYQLPDEYRLDESFKSFSQKLKIPVEVFDTEHFYTKRDAVSHFFKGKKTYLMENFYRKLRKDTGLLMESEDKPLGGKWNFDHENRKPFRNEVPVPEPFTPKNDASEIVALIEKQHIPHIGLINSSELNWPISRAQALAQLQHFLDYNLRYFGTFEDAMHQSHEVLFHSRLSFALNVKMLSPKEVIEQAILHFKQNMDTISLAQIEGFVRQILGWREFMRGIYWAEMPSYMERNYLNNKEPLPSWFWTGDTKMNCLKTAIKSSLNNGYAHHIQRLMITGNFSLLLGCYPNEVDKWYLGIYVDAIQWVEITNTRGMSQFADGGLLATKPYISSANYIKKMSNYCQNCSYNPDIKTGDKSCPFNSLYWDFYHRNRDLLANNARIGLMYKIWDKMKPEAQTALLNRAKFVKEQINEL